MKWEALKVFALFITGNDKQITQNQENPIKQRWKEEGEK